MRKRIAARSSWKLGSDRDLHRPIALRRGRQRPTNTPSFRLRFPLDVAEAPNNLANYHINNGCVDQEDLLNLFRAEVVVQRLLYRPHLFKEGLSAGIICVLTLLPSLDDLLSMVLLVEVGAKIGWSIWCLLSSPAWAQTSLHSRRKQRRGIRQIKWNWDHRRLEKCSAERHRRRSEGHGFSRIVFCASSKTWRR